MDTLCCNILQHLKIVIHLLSIYVGQRQTTLNESLTSIIYSMKWIISNRVRMLVVDSDVQNQLLIRSIFTNEEIDIHQCISKDEFALIYENLETDYDVIILEPRILDMHYSMSKVIFNNSRLIILTSNIYFKSTKDLQNRIIYKPIDIKFLVNKVHEIINQPQTTR